MIQVITKIPRGMCLVGDLKKMIENVDNDTLVILSSDEEGNCYSPTGIMDFTDLDISYDINMGEIFHIGLLTDKLREMGYDEDDFSINSVPAIVLYPGY